MKGLGLFFSLLSVCLLAGCGAEKSVSGQIVEVGMGEGGGIASFVVQTDGGRNTGILVTNETFIFAFANGMTAEKFQAGSFDEAIVTVFYGNARSPITTSGGEEMTAYHGERIQIRGYFAGETTTVSDGTTVEIWRYSGEDRYTLKDGTELLSIQDSIGPDHSYLEGIERLDDLEEGARARVLDFYEQQGLLYDVQTELERAYRAYVEAGDTAPFNTHMLDQDISPTASNETVIYFLTTVLYPIGGDREYEEHFRGAAFHRETGEVIPNWELFSGSPEEAREAILDLAGGDDPTLREERDQALQPENMMFLPDRIGIYFRRGTLPSKESGYRLDLDYDQSLSGLLHPWAIPNSGG